ncbi:MAG: WG repeat-containing protein, partial [Desulfobacterales bacterium]|nr:WG repeat-containing protein [Desulfobacterales bacterium]
SKNDFSCIFSYNLQTSILLLLFFFSLISQLAFCEGAKLPDLIPYRKGTKWGFCDKNKKIVIPCKYDRTMPFNKMRIPRYPKDDSINNRTPIPRITEW